MKKLYKLITILATITLVTGCGSTTKIQSDYDPGVDFSQFKTYGYYSPMGIENPNYSSLLGQMFRDAIDAQMLPRGYVKSDRPDLLINVSARLEDKTKVTTTSNPGYGYGGGYGYEPSYVYEEPVYVAPRRYYGPRHYGYYPDNIRDPAGGSYR